MRLRTVADLAAYLATQPPTLPVVLLMDPDEDSEPVYHKVSFVRDQTNIGAAVVLVNRGPATEEA